VLRFGLLVIAGLLFFATPALAQSSQTVTVERVVDGDTIEVNPAVGGTQDVRLLGVDTPETVDPTESIEPYGPEASAFTERQLEGERVTLIFDQQKTDQYGRTLAYVRIGGQSETLNETLLQQGYAQLYVVPPNDRYEARFSQAQEQARQAQRGIWGLPQEQQCELADRGNGIGEGSPEGAPYGWTSLSGFRSPGASRGGVDSGAWRLEAVEDAATLSIGLTLPSARCQSSRTVTAA
jgi:micrococcal nuclease